MVRRVRLCPHVRRYARSPSGRTDSVGVGRKPLATDEQHIPSSAYPMEGSLLAKATSLFDAVTVRGG
ncbi:MAG: hypothetical protein ACRBN8_43415 [Nannocystales bacterium]